MVLQNVLPMNEGNGESSYANNSTLQKTVILKAQKVLGDTIKDMFAVDPLPGCFKIADLGCSSGPNTPLVISNIIEKVHAVCQEKNVKVPEFHVSLNDLPDNDFNTVFKLLPPFFAKLKKQEGDNFGPCFVSGVPGSFYERIFPASSLHFVHSSNSTHWLSQVPVGLENNKKNILYMAKSSPPDVYQAYMNQFVRDFSNFLRARSEEIISNGRIVLTFYSRSSEYSTSEDSCFPWDMLAKSLCDMVDKGFLDEADMNSFNVPMYFPSKEEAKAIIQSDGSFNLDKLEDFELNWDPRDEKEFVIDKESSGKFLAKTARAGVEPMLASHFGNSFMDDVFESYARIADEHLSRGKTMFFNIVAALTKK